MIVVPLHVTAQLAEAALDHLWDQTQDGAGCCPDCCGQCGAIRDLNHQGTLDLLIAYAPGAKMSGWFVDHPAGWGVNREWLAKAWDRERLTCHHGSRA